MSEESKVPNPEAPESAAQSAPESKPEAAPESAAPAAASAKTASAESAPKPEAKSEAKSESGEKPAARKPRREKPASGDKPEAKPEAKSAESEKGKESASAESAAPSSASGPAFPLADAPQAPVQRKRGKRHVPEAVAHVTATFNNTIVTFADPEGKVIAWSTTGASGFKGARKGTPYAAQIAAENAGRKAQEHGVESVEVRVRGVGSGRDSAVRAINALGIRIGCIRDVTPVPHNGCRPPKRRRV